MTPISNPTGASRSRLRSRSGRCDRLRAALERTPFGRALFSIRTRLATAWPGWLAGDGMTEALEQSFAAWIRFAGFVLVIAVLYLAQAVLVPVALAVLITFVLTPPVTFLQRRIGRGLAVLVTVVLVFTVLG